MVKIFVNLLKRIIETKVRYKLNLQPSPYKLNLIVTNRCNCKCKTCQIWKIYKDNPPLIKKEMNIEEYSKLFKNLGKNLSWLSITGGEPFMREDISRIVSIAVDSCPNLEIISINSNGYLTEKILKTTRDILKATKRVRLFITISVDGSEKTHNKLRGHKDAYKRADLTYLNLKEIKSKKLFVDREITVNKYNIKEVQDTIAKYGDSTIITFAQNSDYYNNLGEDVTPDKKEILRILKDTSVKYKGLQSLIKKIFISGAKEYFRKNRVTLPCYSSWSSVVIDAYGNVFPCLIYQTRLGNIRETNYNPYDVLKNRKTRKAQQKIKSKNCPNCWTPCEAYPTIIQNARSIKYLID